MQVDVTDLRKDYGNIVAIDLLNLHVASGKRFGIVGNNGAGKTTLLRCVLDLIRPTAGHVALDGEQVHRSFDWKHRTGSYLDAGFLISFLTPEEYFHFVGHLYGLPRGEVESAVARFGSLFTESVLGQKRLVRDLSMGNQKKVGLLAALMTARSLLVLDEPFASLDPTSQYVLRGLLKDVHRERGTTMLISSHDLNHVVDVCDRIAVLEEGRIVCDTITTETTLNELETYFRTPLRMAAPATQ
jgi:ABC-2 type transport system ATP-binding protein